MADEVNVPILDKIDDWKERNTAMERFYKAKPSAAAVQQFYAGYSERFEEDMKALPCGYNHPQHVVKVMTEYVTDRSARILDCCCGTGFAGVHLSRLGYTVVDGLDACQGMLDKAAEKHVYAGLYREMVTSAPLTTVASRTYDVVITSGSFVDGHLTADCVLTLLALLKPGGYLVVELRSEYLRSIPCLTTLEEVIDRAVAQDGVKKLRSETVPNYHGDKDGHLFVCQTME